VFSDLAQLPHIGPFTMSMQLNIPSLRLDPELAKIPAAPSFGVFGSKLLSKHRIIRLRQMAPSFVELAHSRIVIPVKEIRAGTVVISQERLFNSGIF